MSIITAAGEQIIKEWNYASTKNGKVSTDYSLTVTNKRVVSMAADKNNIERQEIPVGNVTGIHTVCAKQQKFPAGIILIAVGVAALIILCILKLFMIGCLLGIAIILIGIILILVSIFSSEHFLTVIIYTSRESEELSINVNSAFAHKKDSEQNIKVKVNEAVARDIVQCLGVLLLAK